MTAKLKAIIYSLGVPALYLLAQFVALFIVLFYILMSSIANGTIPIDEYEILRYINDELMEITIANTLPILLITGLIFLLIIFILHIKRPLQLIKNMGMMRDISAKTLSLSALAGFFFNISCQGIIGALPVPESWLEANEVVTESLMGGSILFSVLIVTFFAPFIEEIAFRGFTQRILHTSFRPWLAITAQSIVFAAIHFGGYYLQMIYVFFTALLIGYIYYKTKNFWAAFACHAAYNGANFVVNVILYLLLGEDGEPGLWLLSAMAIGGAVLAILVARVIENRQKETV
ncbi:MAG: CPBP family intramembrane metalloprotease [Oscillospiraceae bacterium]|nr:CPBP family intramembrane metalloprotease [Oscillospiraceae bacterium]